MAHAFTLEPEEADTNLTVKVEASNHVPFLDKIEDKAIWKCDRDLDPQRGSFQYATET